MPPGAEAQSPAFSGRTVILALLAVLGLLLSLSCAGRNAQTDGDTAPAELPAQSSRSGEVNVTVTPLDIRPDLDAWDFQVVMDTHTVELDEDLIQAAVLTDETGREFSPSGYEGDPPGGHHRAGVLRFEPVSPFPQSVILKLRGVGGIGERSFSWMLASS